MGCALRDTSQVADPSDAERVLPSPGHGTIGQVPRDAVQSEGEYLDANIDFSRKNGYFVRVDVELPHDAVSSTRRDDGGPTGWLRLSPQDAEQLAAKLVAAADGVRAQEKTQ